MNAPYLAANTAEVASTCQVATAVNVLKDTRAHNVNKISTNVLKSLVTTTESAQTLLAVILASAKLVILEKHVERTKTSVCRNRVNTREIVLTSLVVFDADVQRAIQGRHAHQMSTNVLPARVVLTARVLTRLEDTAVHVRLGLRAHTAGITPKRFLQQNQRRLLKEMTAKVKHANHIFNPFS